MPNRSDKAPVTHLKKMAKRLGRQLFVSRLSPYTTNEKLEKLFSQFGVVKEARLVRDSETQKPKGFGFITFESEVEAQKALKTMNGRIVDGGLIFVEVAKGAETRDDAGS
ncbi:RNA-binding (RRM/RBD/RNP motifs) family protein [Euphorbia peplus]|nr:RNA-binding (RRM/RBD/RNP motifs) family protein [Euphorbia peplus]